MHLILQSAEGVAFPAHALTRLRELVQPERSEPISQCAWRLRGVSAGAAMRAEVARLCESAQLDFAFVPAGRKLTAFRLLAMDMDSTLIAIECIDEIADVTGLRAQIAPITEAAMRGEITDYGDSFRSRVALLKGLDCSVLEQVCARRLRLSPGAERMLAGVRAAGLKTLLVSGGLSFFTDRLRRRLDFDFAHGISVEIVGGTLSGRIIGPIVDAARKRQVVEQVCRQIGASPRRAIVVGDGANDLEMMSIAGISVGFRAKPIVREKCTYTLNYVGLDGVLNWFE